jgi:hypothetical protein
MRILDLDISISDKDLDGIPDDYEVANGLDPTKDDYSKDLDNDGLENGREYHLDTKPNVADTDGDALSDGEETTGGEDGFVTDPLNTDTDDDGVPDGSDSQPVDGGTSEPGETMGEPEVAVDKTLVNLTKEEWIATVTVTNNGTGTLTWSAATDNDAIAVISPDAPDISQEGQLLLITVPTSYDLAAAGVNKTTIRVSDVAGATKDYKEIIVRVIPSGSLSTDIDIKANKSDGPLNITSNDKLSITVELYPGDNSGKNADWWLYAETPMGSYYYDVRGGSLSWKSGLSVTAQGGLIEFSPFEVLNVSGFPVPTGTYTFNFAIDMNMNGVKDSEIYSDSVQVTVTE